MAEIITCPHCNNSFFHDFEEVTVEASIDRGVETSTQTGDGKVGVTAQKTAELAADEAQDLKNRALEASEKAAAAAQAQEEAIARRAAEEIKQQKEDAAKAAKAVADAAEAAHKQAEEAAAEAQKKADEVKKAADNAAKNTKKAADSAVKSTKKTTKKKAVKKPTKSTTSKKKVVKNIQDEGELITTVVPESILNTKPDDIAITSMIGNCFRKRE